SIRRPPARLKALRRNQASFSVETAEMAYLKPVGESAMRYMMLVKSTKDYEAGVWPDEKMQAELNKWTEALGKAGARLDGGRLQPSSQGARVHYAKGKFTVVDGPFAETKELIAGYCMIEAKSREEAIAWAKRIPFQNGEVEVRQLFELTDFPVDPAE